MPYTRNQPVATDDLSVSQPFLYNNTNSADDSFAIDHYPFSDLTTNNGKHKKVSFEDQTASPPSSTGTEVVSYAITNSGITMPYYKRDGLATVFPLAPIKAYASFLSVVGSGTINITPDDAFNINTPIVQTSGGRNFEITLTNACRTNLYGVVALATGTPLSLIQMGYSIVSNTIFNLVTPASALAATRFTVMVIET